MSLENFFNPSVEDALRELIEDGTLDPVTLVFRLAAITPDLVLHDIIHNELEACGHISN